MEVPILGVKDRAPSQEERLGVLRGLYEAAQKPPGQLTMKERMQLARKGHALPDGSFPIRNMADLMQHAMPSFGRGGNKSQVKRHLLKRARALGASKSVIQRIEGFSV